MTRSARARRRLLAPEMVQTSAMDCGPATLRCLLEGYGIRASYGRLREACQTDVDGTSIDTMEDVACQLGLEAEQVMVPADHLLVQGSELLPAIVVVRRPNGLTHFVLAWRRHGPLLQVMDPAVGRRWVSCQAFLRELYIHEAAVPAAAWRQWAGSGAATLTLHTRLTRIGVSPDHTHRLIEDETSADRGWVGLATLDAATRLTTALMQSGGFRRGRSATSFLEQLVDRARAEPDFIPAPYWSVRPTEADGDGTRRLLLRGAVLVHVHGPAPEAEPTERPAPLPPDLTAALAEPPSRPGRDLLRLVRAEGVLRPLALAVAIAVGAGAVVLQALLLRSLIEVARILPSAGGRLEALGVVLLFMVALLALELPAASLIRRLGRGLETRLRVAFLRKIPLLADRYFSSRLNSDMAERSHGVHRLRELPELAAFLLRHISELLLTTMGLLWIYPAGAPLILLAAALALGLPLMTQPHLLERDLRVRNHLGALSRFYLDGLLGLVPVRTHAAERAMRREHEALLLEWSRAALSLLRTEVVVEGLIFATGPALAALLLVQYLGGGTETSGALLLVYWALHLPVLGQEIGILARQLPAQRNITLRLLEPLGAPEEAVPGEPTAAAEPPAVGVAITLEGVRVQATGHTILDDLDLRLEAGLHVAVVGPSGAGKSSLAGLLLGWHRPAAGHVQVDGEPLDHARLASLRRHTAWVDPSVRLWNRSLEANLRYGNPPEDGGNLSPVISATDLASVLVRLPGALQGPLGEGGALLSGGEGQRVRLARALLRPEVRLVILDEPFRGLDRARRRELLARARSTWRGATLMCITHDVGDTRDFPRVLVMEGGRITEDGRPTDLAGDPSSRYRALLTAEAEVREGLWAQAGWRRVRLASGMLQEGRP